MREITKSEFLGAPKLELKEGTDDSWKLIAPLYYNSALLQKQVMVPEGFETDFASVPRLPLAYLFAGGKANAAAIVHDYFCVTKEIPRSLADEVFLEAMEATGIPAYTRYLMYVAVRGYALATFQWR